MQSGSDRPETTEPGGYPADINNPDDWAGFLSRYLDNRVTSLAHNGIGLIALHIVDVIKDAKSPAVRREERLEEALWRIAQWSDAYPVEVFPRPDADYLRRAHEVLTANGMTLARLSADAMRHVVDGVGKIAKEALNV